MYLFEIYLGIGYLSLIFVSYFYLNMRLEEEIRQKQFKSAFEKGLVNFIYTYNWVDAQMKEFFKSFDLTNQQYNVLRILRGQHPTPATINLLRERMLDKMSDASRIVERLRLKDLLERHTSEYDRRSVDICITEEGLALLGKIDVLMDRHQCEIFKNLTVEEVEQLNILFDKLRG